MGWWKISSPESGGIDWNTRTTGKLLNAIPRRDTPENHYNGDIPADYMGKAWQDISAILETPEEKLDREAMRAAFFAGIGDPRVVSVFQAARTKIEAAYRREWGRPPYQEEWMAVFNFVCCS